MIETIIIFELLFGAFGKRQVSRPVVAGVLGASPLSGARATTRGDSAWFRLFFSHSEFAVLEEPSGS